MTDTRTTRIEVLTKERINTLIAEKKQVLGRGASAIVYLVEVGGKLCCLKMGRVQGVAPLFRQEFEILLDLDGTAGAPRALGTTFGSQPAMLTTLCGFTTFWELRRLAVSDTDRLSFFLKLARSVKQLHARGYSHNDIKEDNVVLGRTGNGRMQVSLIDYGLAKKFGSRIDFRGTDPRRLPWVAKELVLGAPCSPAMDVFSLGYVLNNILDLCHGEYPALEDLVDSAMDDNPSQRPSVTRFIRTVKRVRFCHRVRQMFCCFNPRRRQY